jgi:PAS domain S-box-containing protein
MRLPVARSLQSRMMISVSCLLVFLMIVTVLAVDERLGGFLLRTARERADAVSHAFAAAIANDLASGDERTLNEAARKAIEEDGIAYVFVLDGEGRLLARAERAGLGGAGLEDEVSRWVRQSPSREHRYREVPAGGGTIRVLDVRRRVALEPGAAGEPRFGEVGIGFSLQTVQEATRRVRLVLLVIGICGVGLGVVGARVISRRITSSLADLVRGTIAVSEGDLEHRIPIRTDDEIAKLAEHFNFMTEQVRRQQEEIAGATRELEMLNATLEEKVSLRNQEFFASEEKYRILIENSPDPILISQDGLIRFVNPAFERVFGYSFGGMVRESFPTKELFHPDDRRIALEYLGRIVRGEHVEAGEIRGLTRDGRVRIFELRGMWITYLGDPAVEIILTDTTEKKELQEHLLQHEKLRALGELASGVAHDFNNILGIILGRAQLLQSRVGDPDVQKGLRTIERAAFDGGETVRRIQDFARSRTASDFDDIDLNVLLPEVVEITRTRWKDEAEVRNVKIDVSVDLGEIPNIKGNASEIREVYTNLIFNAVDAMPDGGRVTIESYTDGDDAVVEVRDTGRGMKEHVRARVFDPFFTTKTKGMGLGMSVVYGIVERHRGRISVESAPGVGTTFTIRIPGAPPAAPAEACAPAASRKRDARVLVIDDEEDILELVSEMLEVNGLTSRTATSGPEALEFFRPGEFDVLFCDLGMREMSGWEVVRAIRAREPAIPVVLLTGWGATLAEEKLKSHGVDAVLGKPFEMSKVLETLDRVLEGRAEPRPAAPARVSGRSRYDQEA